MESEKDVNKIRKVDSETASLELGRFLDIKRISERKRKDLYEQSIKELEYAVSEGLLVFDFEKKTATFKLLFPLTRKEGGKIEKLELRFNMGVSQAFNNLKNVDASDGDERSLSMIAALSGQSAAVLRLAKNEQGESGLDTSDFSLLRYFALFFLA